MWEDAFSPRRRTSRTQSSIFSGGWKSIVGSMFPCSALSGPTTIAATSSGIRQSTATTSIASVLIAVSSVAQSFAKWITGTPLRFRPATTCRVYGSAYSS